MTATESLTVMVTDEQSLVIERVFDAPPELVWRAWTEAEHFARWYGPEGVTVPKCEIDFRVGGRYSLTMRSPDGWEMQNTGVYQEIVIFEHFVATMEAEIHDDTLLTVTLEDLGDGRTKLTLRQDGWADPNMAAGAGGGWSQALEKLAVELAQ